MERSSLWIRPALISTPAPFVVNKGQGNMECDLTVKLSLLSSTVSSSPYGAKLQLASFLLFSAHATVGGIVLRTVYSFPYRNVLRWDPLTSSSSSSSRIPRVQGAKDSERFSNPRSYSERIRKTTREGSCRCPV